MAALSTRGQEDRSEQPTLEEQRNWEGMSPVIGVQYASSPQICRLANAMVYIGLAAHTPLLSSALTQRKRSPGLNVQGQPL